MIVVIDTDLQAGVLAAAVLEIPDPRGVAASAPAVAGEVDAQAAAPRALDLDVAGRVERQIVGDVIGDADLELGVLATAVLLVANPGVVAAAPVGVVGEDDAVVAPAGAGEEGPIATRRRLAADAAPAHHEVPRHHEVAAAGHRHAPRGVEHDVVVAVVGDPDLEAGVLAPLGVVPDVGVVAAATPAVVRELEAEGHPAGAVEAHLPRRIQLDVVVGVVHVADLKHRVLAALPQVPNPAHVTAAAAGVLREGDAVAADRRPDAPLEGGVVGDREEAAHPQVTGADDVDPAPCVEADVVFGVVADPDLQGGVLPAAVADVLDPSRVSAAAEGVVGEANAAVAVARRRDDHRAGYREVAADAGRTVDPQGAVSHLEVRGVVAVPVARRVRTRRVLDEEGPRPVEAKRGVLGPEVEELQARVEALVADLRVVAADPEAAGHVGGLGGGQVPP